MDVQAIARLRLANQQISGGGYKKASEVVRHMGAMQAQDYYGALWSIGLRTGLSEKQVIAAVENGEILRTWPQRGTLHFVPAADAKWLVGLSAERLLKGAVRRRARLGLDDDILVRSKAALIEMLGGGTVLTRPKIVQALEGAGISTAGQRGYHILWNLSQKGITCVGPMEGKQQTFALLDDWAPSPHKLMREAGIAEHAKRYFTSHGPATLQDFMWWSGLTSADAKAGLAANESLFINEKIDGKTYWFAKDSKAIDIEPEAFLLPGFDEYVLGYRDRSAILHADHAPKIVPGGNGMFTPTVVIGGQIVGTWRRTIKKDHVLLNLTPFAKFTKSDLKLLQDPADQYGHFLGLPVRLA